MTKSNLTISRLFMIVLFLALLILTMRPIADPDFWWHLRTGELISETHSIPHTDPYSFTNPGRAWIAHEWLSELGMYALYRLGGYGLLIVAFAAIIVTAFLLTYLVCPAASRPYVAGFTLLLGALTTAPTWGARPQMLSLVLTALFLFFLDRYHTTRNLRFIIFLPLITILWVNLHAGFELGLAVIGIYMLGETIEIIMKLVKGTVPAQLAQFKDIFWMAGIFAACLAAILVNPNGYRMYIYPFETLTSQAMQQFIQEWASPDFHQIEWQPLIWLILILIGGGFVSRKPVSPIKILLVLFFGYAALRSMRNVPFFAITAVPVVSEEIGTWLQIKTEAFIPKKFAALSIAALILVGVLLAGGRFITVNEGQSKVTQESFPARAVDWIEENRPDGNIYNTYGWGGYLIWRLYPQYRVYIDGRADMYGDQFIFAYTRVYSAQADWEKTFQSSGVKIVLVEPGSGLAHAMRGASSWRIAYQDSASILFIRDH